MGRSFSSAVHCLLPPEFTDKPESVAAYCSREPLYNVTRRWDSQIRRAMRLMHEELDKTAALSMKGELHVQCIEPSRAEPSRAEPSRAVPCYTHHHTTACLLGR